ncbi:hypothetical protein DFAR_970011 [Desulfarculales bacterium]
MSSSTCCRHRCKMWLPEGHLVYFVIEVVERLDLSEGYKAYGSKGGCGHPPYDSRVVVRFCFTPRACPLLNNKSTTRILTSPGLVAFFLGDLLGLVSVFFEPSAVVNRHG